MSSSAIILSGGLSKRFGAEKALVPLEGRPLIQYAIDVATPIVDECIVVVRTPDQGERIRDACDGSFRITFDDCCMSSPLVGVLAGMNEALGRVSLLLACDTPLLSIDVLSLLLHTSSSYDAVIPRWPNGNIEPLQALYNTCKTRETARQTVEAGRLRIYDAIRLLKNVSYVSTEVLKQLDPCLHTFQNVNTPEDLEYVRSLLRIKLGQNNPSIHDGRKPVHEFSFNSRDTR